jgi:hypothetical protein
LAQPFLCNGVLFERGLVSWVNRALRRQYASGRAARNSLGTDEFGDYRFIIAPNGPLTYLSEHRVPPVAKANREITSTTRTMRQKQPKPPPKAQAKGVVAQPTMVLWHVRRRSRIPTERMAGIDAEDLGVQQNTGALTQICDPCAPPVISIRISGNNHRPELILIMFSSVERLSDVQDLS